MNSLLEALNVCFEEFMTISLVLLLKQPLIKLLKKSLVAIPKKTFKSFFYGILVELLVENTKKKLEINLLRNLMTSFCKKCQHLKKKLVFSNIFAMFKLQPIFAEFTPNRLTKQ